MSQSEITTANCPSLVSVKRLRHKTPALEGTEGEDGHLIIWSPLKIAVLALPGDSLVTKCPKLRIQEYTRLGQLSIVEVTGHF